MASKLYDIDASTARVARAQEQIAAQQTYILTLPLDGRGLAQLNLETLENMLDIAEKTHVLITKVVLARREIDHASSLTISRIGLTLN